MKLYFASFGKLKFEYVDGDYTHYSMGDFRFRCNFESKIINGYRRSAYQFMGTDEEFTLFLLQYGEYIAEVE